MKEMNNAKEDLCCKAQDVAIRAAQLFEQGYTCCQAVACPFANNAQMDEHDLFKIGLGFGGGMGGLREVCGAVTGAFMILSAAMHDKMTKGELYALQQKFAARFKEKWGSIICRQLLKECTAVSGIPSERTAEYYHKRPCSKIVFYAAQLLQTEFMQGDYSTNTP